MRKKNFVIKILPRILSFTEVGVLFVSHYITERGPKLEGYVLDNIVGPLMIIGGTAMLVLAFKHNHKTSTMCPMFIAGYVILIGLGIFLFSWLWFIILAIFIPIWYFYYRLKKLIDEHA